MDPMNFAYMIMIFSYHIVTLYIYLRLVDVPGVTRAKIVSGILFSLVSSIALSFFLHLAYPIAIVLGIIFIAITTRAKVVLIASGLLISLGMSMGLELLLSLILALPLLLIQLIRGEAIVHSDFSPAIVATIMSILMLFLANRLLAKDRLKKGILFWENRKAILVGLVFSIGIFVQGSLYGRFLLLALDEIPNEPLVQFILIVLPASAIFINAIGLYLWWRYHTTALYQQRIQEREMAAMREQIAALSKGKDILSEMVHRDNKLVPAMYSAVSRFLSSDSMDEQTRATKGLQILNELSELMQAQDRTISAVQGKYKALPSTGIELADAILNYMYQKAADQGTQFNFTLSGDIKESTARVIQVDQFGTLLADLLENALSATFYASHKNVRATMGIVDDCFEITVSDSGVPFEIATLARLGKEKATTRADEGGSGIGWMTIFEILGKTGGSLTITEYADNGDGFTKTITVRFDGMSEYVVQSYRAQEILVAVQRDDLRVELVNI